MRGRRKPALFVSGHRDVAWRVYNQSMAKGWESKSVEEQQSLASQAPLSDDERQRLDKEHAEKARHLQTLQLSRARVVDQISRCTNDRYREMLERELAHLDGEISKAGG